jgi:hypothetical protein
MKNNPNEMLVGNLECVLMANGEIISGGKTIGWFDTHGQYFTPVRHVDGSPVAQGEYE